MSLNIVKTKDIEEIASFVSASINKQLELGKNVLWFVTGGSSIPYEVLVSKKINNELSSKLVVILTDERYGLVNNQNSNWFKLKLAGFDAHGNKLIPILIGKDLSTTTLEVRKILKEELDKAEYKIASFGIGIDGHTAGILPHSEAINSDELICTFYTELFDRITITPRTISMLDEGIVFAVGELKWAPLENLEKDISVEDQPAQALKKIPKLTIFSDYNK